MRFTVDKRTAAGVSSFFASLLMASTHFAATPPINIDKLQGAKVIDQTVNALGIEQVSGAIKEDRDGLTVDFSEATTLLDGTRIDPGDIYGVIHYGPAWFAERDGDQPLGNYRLNAVIENGRGLIKVEDFLSSTLNTEGWRDRGVLAIRAVLFLARRGPDVSLGTYETMVGFLRSSLRIKRIPCVVEGPFVNLVTSANPTELVISFKTDLPTRATVMTKNNRTFNETPPNKTSTDHLVLVTGLKHDAFYEYKIKLGDLLETSFHTLKTAPVSGRGVVSFGLCGGSGDDARGVMGVDVETLQRNMLELGRRNVDFCLFAGNMIGEATTNARDFNSRFHAWKRAVTPFWRGRVIYPAMGNGVINVMRVETTGKIVRMDRWPYRSRSSEALFSDTFLNPRNAPKTANPRLPSYSENAYSFQYGTVKVIVFNNNFWYSEDPSSYGGSPPGYVMKDQVDWILNELKKGDMDPKVRYMFLCSRGPMFPCGDAGEIGMWRNGDNNVRAVTFVDRKPKPAKLGLIQVRNNLLKAITGTSKVVAVLSGGEPCYYRMWLTDHVPVGLPGEDDVNRDGVIAWRGDEKPSPLKDAKYGVWFISSGGCGAPYSVEREAPWIKYWKSRKNPEEGYFFSSRSHVVTFVATSRGVELKAISPHGEVIDQVPNLLKGKLLPKPKKK